MLFRSLRKVGAMSPDYSGRMFDFDLACKLHGDGKHAVVTPLTHVRYLGGETSSTNDTRTFEQRWGRFVGSDPFTRIETRVLLSRID